MTKPYPLIITNNDVLDDWCGTLEKCDPVAVDTEGDSLHCYFEKLCLIQIGLPEQDVLIDPLEPLDFSRFNARSRSKKNHLARLRLRSAYAAARHEVCPGRSLRHLSCCAVSRLERGRPRFTGEGVL